MNPILVGKSITTPQSGNVYLLPKYGNRHGLVAGATGTGKTVTLMTLAEGFSKRGVPVFLADIKGDLSGLATAATANEKLTARTQKTGMPWASTAYPVEFLALGGDGTGIPVRATVDSFGPLLLSRVMDLNDTQESSLQLMFHWADERELPLDDLKDLRAVVLHLTSDQGKADLQELGGVAKSTANVILREITARHGALLIWDEVLTGFRATDTGAWGLSGRVEGWTPDIWCFGKVIGGGMPAAALGGSAEIMDHLAPLGPVYQAGTLSGNPVAMAAGHATLSRADEAVYAAVTRASDAVREGLVAALDAEGVDHSIQRAGTLFSLAFGTSGTGVRDYRDAQGQEVFRYAPFFQSMLASGVYLPPSVFEAWFVSAAHDDAAVTRVLDALPAAAKAAAAATPQG